MERIKVLLVDDHTVVRQGLRVLLEAEPDILVVGEASSGREAVQLTAKLLPDVVVMDVAMPGLNGLEATRQILGEMPTAKVLVLSSYNDDEYIERLSELGAVGYLLKQNAVADLLTAVREARKGNAFFSPAISKRLLERYRQAFRSPASVRRRTDPLTSREAEVLQLVAEGRPNKYIAAELGISIKTVEKHRQQMMDKLHVHDIAGLTRYALAKGVVEGSPPLRLSAPER